MKYKLKFNIVLWIQIAENKNLHSLYLYYLYYQFPMNKNKIKNGI